ncbi:C6 zinc cluster transcription factor-like protein [Cladophialophora chaetospira]|uniref:C6 zinc cluster transcription factor-like protein n=1 Tax=Cladophialophora chaetospira TaxID=386627 RepID=A0AA39CDS6_9EURO|nr:C6 zinc cluster transcription factor-like protein [Cladophialophora chaetospira]
MPVTEIYILRHGHRLAWSLNPLTGKYTSSHPFPTRLPADPPLASHGVRQAQETGRHLATLFAELVNHDRLRIYSSLFYRCLETLRPSMEALLEQIPESDAKRRRGLAVRGERGLGEWFGQAWFVQPSPADAARLQGDFFPWLDDKYHSMVVPPENGERIEELHERVATALATIVKDVDEEYSRMGRGDEEVTILISGHAAPIIASGRALTGQVPDDWDEEDFQCFTCGLSKFVRRHLPPTEAQRRQDYYTERAQGVAGGWDCVLNSDCSHLSHGEERGWHFHGDESFDSYGAPNAAVKVSDGTVHASKL